MIFQLMILSIIIRVVNMIARATIHTALSSFLLFSFFFSLSEIRVISGNIEGIKEREGIYHRHLRSFIINHHYPDLYIYFSRNIKIWKSSVWFTRSIYIYQMFNDYYNPPDSFWLPFQRVKFLIRGLKRRTIDEGRKKRKGSNAFSTLPLPLI